MIGNTILHYKILEKIGEGGMGIVYLAEDTKLKRKVAIKFLPRQITADDDDRRRFEIEAQAAASLNHLNITTIYAIEEEKDDVFIVMEYIDGIELKERIKSGEIQIDEAINIAIQIAEGLEAAHKKGIVHRDIKSGNIMITQEGKVKIMDFGLAKIGTGQQVTKLGSTIGTIAYMSPEQAQGETLDQRTDLWSFGIILYEMLTGTQPFKGAYDQAVIYSILNENPEFANIPGSLINILKKAIAKNPAERYQNAGLMLDDLKALTNDSQSKSFFKTVSFVKTSKKSNLKWIVTTAVIIIIAAVTIFYLLSTKNVSTVNTQHNRKMIVVMPFENLGPQDEKYFADGITDEITSKLASIGNIGVISQSSAEKLSKSNKSTQEIGKELGVDYILNGTIRWAKSGKNENRVRITPQLTRVSDNTITWSDSYDRVLNDIFAVQNDIAQKVVDQLGGSFSNGQINKEVPPTNNLDAYDFYLRGLAYENRGVFSKSDIQNSIALFNKALKLDPKFAAAYAHLSKNKTSLYWFYFDRSEKNLNEAYTLAKKAEQLDPNLAEVHLAFGYYYYWGKLNYEKAIDEFSKALKFKPNFAEAFAATGYVYRRMGNFNLAIQNLIKGSSLDPLSTEYSRNLGETYGLVRNYEKSVEQYQRVIDLIPDMSLPKAELAQIYVLWKGDLKTAASLMKKITDNNYIDVMQNYDAYLNILERNFDEAINDVKEYNKPFESGQFRYISKNLMLGLIYKYKNEIKLSDEYLDSSRVELEKMLKGAPKDERLHSSLGITYAALGLNDRAIAEGKKGIELLPLEKEAYRGYFRQLDMAVIYTLIGDKDNALKQIDFILSIPGTFSVSLLKLDPIFDSLRILPGYKAILEKYSN